MLRHLTAAALLALGLCGATWAQDKAPAAAPQAPAATAPGTTAASPGIQSANIFDIRPDASTDPNYARQSNGQRAQVQPGNNAPMWRQVNGGVNGYSSLPKSEAPEAGNLIQPFVQARNDEKSCIPTRQATASAMRNSSSRVWNQPTRPASIAGRVGALCRM